MDAAEAGRGEVVGLVFARGGSKGVHRKNLQTVDGQPLVARAVATAVACPSISRVLVSTDDPEIADAARAAGAEVPFLRPAALAADDAPEWQSWRHVVEWLAKNGPVVELLAVVPPTAPLRAPTDVEACIASARDGDADLVLTVTSSPRSPYFTMVEIDDGGYATLAFGAGERYHRRQDAPVLYDITPVAYVTTPAYVMSANHLFDGRVRTVLVPPERAIDVDTELDLRIARCLSREA